jgi:hypothetical protein
MDGQPKASTVASKSLLLLFVLRVITIFLMKAPLISSSAWGARKSV